MNIKRNVVTKFLDLVKLKGDVESTEAIFNISKSGINILTKTSNNILALKGNLKGEYEDIGDIGIGDLGLLKNFVSSFSTNELQLTKNKNKLVLKATDEKLEIQANLTNPEYIKINVPQEKFDALLTAGKGNEFTLTQDMIKKISTYANTIKAEDIILSGDGTKLKLQLDEFDNRIVSEFEIKETVKPFKVKFQASYLTNLLTSITEDVIVSAHTNKFVYFKIQNDEYTIEYMLAPIEIKEK